MRKVPLKLDSSKTLTNGAQQAIFNAQELARVAGSERVESVHLLLGALQIEPPDAQLAALLQISGLKTDEVRLYAQTALEHQQSLAPDAQPRLSKSAKHTLQLAGKQARYSNRALVDVSHIFIACFNSQISPKLAEVLAPLGVSAEQLSLHLRQLARGEAAKAIQDQSPLARLTAHGERALDAAHAAMRTNFCGRISTMHLLIGVLENPESDAVTALQTLMIDVDELKARSNETIRSDGEIAGPDRRFTPAAKRALDRAKAAAREDGRSYIGGADLLIGLLPQPLLLIERAQFGARPDDPAATLLRDVNADSVRAIFNPRQAATQQLVKQKSANNARDIRFQMLIIFFCVQLIIILSMSFIRFAKGAATELAMLMMAILIGSAIISCGMLIFSEDATRKANWQWAFAGAITGMWTGIIISDAIR